MGGAWGRPAVVDQGERVTAGGAVDDPQHWERLVAGGAEEVVVRAVAHAVQAAAGARGERVPRPLMKRGRNATSRGQTSIRGQDTDCDLNSVKARSTPLCCWLTKLGINKRLGLSNIRKAGINKWHVGKRQYLIYQFNDILITNSPN